jgi:fatty-acyl-CoA synthase
MTVATPRLSESLGRFLERCAAARPASVVWDEATIGLPALLEESRRVARGLADLGIGKGDRVALWLPNAPAWLALYLACARLGAIAVAVNTRFRSSEIADIVGRSGARLLALWPDFRHIDSLGILGEVDRAALDRLEGVILYGSAEPPGGRVHGKPVIAYEALRQRPVLEGDLGDGPVGSIIFTTSGTTSAPKFVLHDHYSVVSHARAVARGYGYDQPGAVLLQALPLCGVFGFCQAMAAFAGGAVTILTPTFAAEAAAQLIDRHAVTMLNGSDEMFARLLAVRAGAVPFPSLRACHFAAFNPTMTGIAIEAEQRGLSLSGLYGSSEAQALFSRRRSEAAIAERARPGGVPVGEDYGVRVRDPESGRLLRAGESGELELFGPSLMAGYFEDDQATARAFTADGWFRSGDLGRLEGDGSFVYETRMGDVLRLGGYLVAPSEIESYVQRFPGIAACEAVGATNDGRLAAVAFVTLSPGAAFDEAALRSFCAAGLARFKVPARCVALDAFPTTESANGTKVQRAKLREMAQHLLAGTATRGEGPG